MHPWRLDFAVSDAVRSAIAAAKETASHLAADNIVTCFEFPEFGALAIGQRCKGISSDSFMQMSLALAFFRDQGEVPVTYETASLRSFFHGRTECIRPQSMEMTGFLRAFDAAAGAAASLPPGQLAELVRQSGEAHKDYTKRCMAGNGVDRHLMGLRIIAAESGMPVHPLFADKAYRLSTTYTLSTSQMPWAVEDWPGFGAYDPGTYGVCYRFTKFDTIVATVTSRRGGKKDAKRFAEHIRVSLRDMMSLLSSNPPRSTSKM
jgi:carnitine O-acetyltransferase